VLDGMLPPDALAARAIEALELRVAA
jgi:hypothetical protein